MLKAGKKTKLWDLSRRSEIKPFFNELGIITCELLGVVKHKCTFDNYLTFAHAQKRRFLTDNEVRTEVILACKNGHDVIEYERTKEQMEIIVKGIIDNREII